MFALFVASAVLCNNPAGGAESEIRFHIKMNISADPAIKILVRSYLNRELRALSDVEFVDINADWSISIICARIESIGGYPASIFLSIVITERYPNAAILSMLPAESKQLGDEITSNLYLARDHWVRSGSQENLQQICSKIVADFDILYLEKERQRWKNVQDFMQQKKNSK
ncbi:MAG: hypothetical protein JRE47_06690 [Deltaproteobacteria bacterium]|nr:hypothetical protein [Deltaproteobacteria bacterium]